jgi:phosphohistidine phosphatase
MSMRRQLLLLRHGKSDWRVDVKDFDRPLKTRGKRGAQCMGIWLLQQAMTPDYIVSSPAERASNTSAKLAKAMGLTTKHIHYDPRIYQASIDDLKAVLATCPTFAKRVLLVGHNPDLEELLHYLHDGSITTPEDGKLMATATLAVLQMPDNWKDLPKSSAKLISLTRAANLPETFPFNGLTGPEQRLRPAYYYSQSAALPYRIINQDIEILLISSSGNNHWGIPKGIIEPGYSAQDSAAIEACEEAGVTGTISQQMLGCYEHEKWGGTCTIQVYPLAVENISDETDWEENHRKRQWVSIKQASLQVKHDALQHLIMKFDVLMKDRRN